MLVFILVKYLIDHFEVFLKLTTYMNEVSQTNIELGAAGWAS